MWNYLVILVLCFCSLTNAVPLGLKKNMAIVQEQEDPMLVMAEDEETRPEMMISRLNLPSNATSIRADITDGFSCDNKTYGYYADVENECQIFHVCLPVTYADGKENTFRWSFICPEETVFSQEYFTCMRSEDMSIDCEESFKYYELNRNFGMIEPEEVPADEAEDEMNMEEMPRDPPSQSAEEEVNKQSIESAPAKKPNNKVKNPNRRKTQTNRVAIEAQRKKVQPLRRLPKPAVVATSVKPVVEESPIVEQEVEKTTTKYQRFTKKPIAILPEQPKPEEPKPEKEILRQELFAQKRKRPQIYFPTRFDTTVQSLTDSESKPLPFLKTDILMHKQPEPVVVQQEPEAETAAEAAAEAESQAQASEITEVSIKPQVELKTVQPEKIENFPVQKKEPVVVSIPIKEEDEPIIEKKSEIASLPENVPSRVEVVEIPIQKLDEPLMAEGSVVLEQVPEVAMPEEPKSEEAGSIKTEEEKIPTDDGLLKKIVIPAENVAETKKPEDDEKILTDTVQEPQLATLDEPEQSLKSAEQPKPLEPMQIADPIIETKMPEQATLSEEAPLKKLEEPLVDAKPDVLENIEAPVLEQKPAESNADILLKTELPAEEATLAEVPTPEKPEESQMALKINLAAPEVNEPQADITKDLAEDPKPQVTESEISEAQSDETVNFEPVNLNVEIPEVKPVEPMPVEAAPPAQEISPENKLYLPEMPLTVETSIPEISMQQSAETSPLESTEKKESLPETEAEAPVSNEEVTKTVETISDAKIELPIEQPKPMENLIEPVKEAIPEVELSSEFQAEKSSELPTDKRVTEEQLTGENEKETIQAVTDNEEAQSLILDFISSLVNSENSNFEDQSLIGNEMTSDSLPEASIAEHVAYEAETPEVPSPHDQINPYYMPEMQNNEQMYQIPVQVIETPEPESVPEAKPETAPETAAEPEMAPEAAPEVVPEAGHESEPAVSMSLPVPMKIPVPVPAVAQPKLPLTVDDVVELVKESLDTPVEKVEKENLLQEPSNDDGNQMSQPDSEEVKPIYHRYFELGSNLLKSEALTASDDEPIVIQTANEKTSPELSKTSENLPEPDHLAPKLDTPPDVLATPVEQHPLEEKADSNSASESEPQTESLKQGRSLNRFRMDPRKRRFLFRSDAS